MDELLREFVRQRAANRCEYCLLPQSAASFFTFHVEHIRARQHGGLDLEQNLALACPDCNAHKGPNLTSIDPTTDAIVPLFDPRHQTWDDHLPSARCVHPRRHSLRPSDRGTAKPE